MNEIVCIVYNKSNDLGEEPNVDELGAWIIVLSLTTMLGD